MRHVIGIGHSHLHAVTDAWRELEARHPDRLRYTPICLIEPRFAPDFIQEKDASVPNPAWFELVRDSLARDEAVWIFLFLCGSEHFRWSVTPGPRPFDIVEPRDDDGAALVGELIPYDLAMSFARDVSGFVAPFARSLRRLTAQRLVQVIAPPPPRDMPGLLAAIPDTFPGVAEFGVSPLPFRAKIWRLASRALTDVCAETGIAAVPCPPEALEADGALREDMVSDIVHGNVVWGRLIVRELLRLAGLEIEAVP